MIERVCIVGNGPSAEGRGDIIDACDFVVRMKDFWHCGAKTAGSRIDAHAYYGWWTTWPDDPCEGFEHWFTHCPGQLEHAGVPSWDRLYILNTRATHQPIYWVWNELWTQLAESLDGDHPSTGFVCVGMALERFGKQLKELVLYGFDSTTPEQPNFFDFDEQPKTRPYNIVHSMLHEKRLLAKLAAGQWLGKPCSVKLTWPDMPDMPPDLVDTRAARRRPRRHKGSQ